VLSPILFNVYAEYIIKRSLQNREEEININGTIINNIRYADDTVILAEIVEQLQTLMKTLNKQSEEMGLTINKRKTKAMVFSKTVNPVQLNIIVGNDSYIYIGREINSALDHSKEIRRRREISRSVFMGMRKILCNVKISKQIRLRTLRCCIWSILYGCETWTLKKKDVKLLQSFEMCLYRRMQRISWTQRIRNEEVLNRMETLPELINIIKTRKTTYLGHLMRHEEYSMLQIMLQGKVEGKRNVGRKGNHGYKILKTGLDKVLLFYSIWRKTEKNSL
jgi:hypothetical protein